MPAKPLSAEQKRDAERLRDLMAEAKKKTGLTQALMAEKCGWESQSTVSQYVNAKIPLNIEALAKMCAELDVSLGKVSPSLEAEAVRVQNALTKLDSRQFRPLLVASAPCSEGGASYSVDRWPFSSISPDRYGRLPETDRLLVEGMALGLVTRWEASHAEKNGGS